MGGKGSGGARVGAGRKSKTDAERWLSGNAGKRGIPVRQAPEGAGKAVELIPVPPDLPADQAEVWNALAPHACGERTLLPATVQAFRDLCEAIVMKRRLLAEMERDGFTYLRVTIDGSGQEHTEVKAHPLMSQHRGLMVRVESGMTRFRLAPTGKALVSPEAPKDEWAEFDQVN